MKFKKFLIIYFVILIVLSGVFLIYVQNSLNKYENSDIDIFMGNITKKITIAAKKGNVSKYINYNNIQISDLEHSSANFKNSYKSIFKTQNITYRKNSESILETEPIYDIFADNKLIVTITLNIQKHETRLGLLTFPVWEIKDIKPNLDKGLYCYTINVPEDYEVIVNNTKLDNSYIINSIENPQISELIDFIDIPSFITYQIPYLIYKPTISILDNNGQETNYLDENENITCVSTFKNIDNFELALEHLDNKNIDILKIAQMWSLFLTKDLTGSNYGFSQLKPYLIEDTYLWDMAYSWATSVDITFVSAHKLKNPPFTNEAISDFIIYNENAFSCIVYLEKNMLIGSKEQTDIMHNRFFFVNYDDTNDNINNPKWKLVSMQSITK